MSPAEINEFFGSLRHAPLLTQVVFFAAFGAVAQTVALCGGWFLLWSQSRRRRRYGLGLLSFGLGVYGLAFWIVSLA